MRKLHGARSTYMSNQPGILTRRDLNVYNCRASWTAANTDHTFETYRLTRQDFLLLSIEIESSHAYKANMVSCDYLFLSLVITSFF